MSDPVFLWQADGPGAEASGACVDQANARQAAEEHLLSGRAVTAVVEEAVAEVGRMVAGARQSHYRRTGDAWKAHGGQDGIRWVPVKAETGAR